MVDLFWMDREDITSKMRKGSLVLLKKTIRLGNCMISVLAGYLNHIY